MDSQTIIKDILSYGPYVIAAAAAAAAALPQGAPDSTWSKVRRLIDFLAANFGNAKNAPKSGPSA